MFITDDMIEEMVRLYGRPREWEVTVPTARKDYDIIKNSQKDGRDHDVTVYIRKGEQLVVNAKHFYPPGLYRAPSGGLKPGEDFHTGIRREMLEETGCEVKLIEFLLKTRVLFKMNDKEKINWRSFVFLADYVSGDFNFTDTREIREVRLADWDEFKTFSKTMREINRAGFNYRAALHDRVRDILFPGTSGQ